MFRKEFADIVGKMGMVPLKDLRPFLLDKDPNKIGETGLTSLSFFDDEKFGRQIAKSYSLPFIDLSNSKIPDQTLSLVKRGDAIEYRCIPIQKNQKAITLAIYDPTIIDQKSKLMTIFQHPVEFIITNISSWGKLFERVNESVDELLGSIKQIRAEDVAKEENVKEEDIGDEVIEYVNKILAESYMKQASDIHVEPYEKMMRIRLRIDGTLIEIDRPDKKMLAPLVSRMKIMANLDIAEKRKPQDGRIKMKIGNNIIDYRVSSLPTLFGEKIVLRLLDQANLKLDMTKLGFEKKQLDTFKEGIYKPYGMCLVTGPTGSGKTTTLYSAISDLNASDTNISTAEDPVEYNLEGINQVNIRRDIGLNFSVALKAFLRQDPDIIMIGEIRDLEVGEIAVEAALTGHLVLSTLHTNDAPSTITRLINMGIEPFLLVAALNVVVAQRLCRKICENCKVVDESVTVDQIVAAGIAPQSAKMIKVYKGTGCKHCNGIGTKGRVAIYEVLGITPAVREVIMKGGSADELKRQAIREGMKTLRMAALSNVAKGLISLDEAVANSASDKF